MINKEEYRTKIILTASRIFSHYGFRKTTMDEISRALKKGKSSIYYYFGSKEEIFEAVVLYEANQLRAQLTKAMKEVDSPPDKLRNYIFVRMRAFAKLSNYYNAVFDKNLDHYEFIEKIRSRYDREELAILRLLVYLGNSRGIFDVRGQRIHCPGDTDHAEGYGGSALLAQAGDGHKQPPQGNAESYF